jgi:hypothetical protein
MFTGWLNGLKKVRYIGADLPEYIEVELKLADMVKIEGVVLFEPFILNNPLLTP